MSVEWGRRPSNGTEGDIQRSWTCASCTIDHDHGWHSPDADDTIGSCPILDDALFGEHSYPNPEGPPEWGQDRRSGRWVCSSYRGPCSCEAMP